MQLVFHAFFLSPLINSSSSLHLVLPCMQLLLSHCSRTRRILLYLMLLLLKCHFCLLCRHQLYIHACSSCSPSNTDFATEQIHFLYVVQRCRRCRHMGHACKASSATCPATPDETWLVLAEVVVLFMYRMDMSQYARCSTWGKH